MRVPRGRPIDGGLIIFGLLFRNHLERNFFDLCGEIEVESKTGMDWLFRNRPQICVEPVGITRCCL